MDFRDLMIFGQSDGGTFGSFEDSADVAKEPPKASKKYCIIDYLFMSTLCLSGLYGIEHNRTIQFWKHGGSIQYKMDPAFGILVEFIPSPRRTSRASSAWALAQRSCDNAKQRWTRMGPCSTWWAALVLWLPLVAIGFFMTFEVSFSGEKCGKTRENGWSPFMDPFGWKWHDDVPMGPFLRAGWILPTCTWGEETGDFFRTMTTMACCFTCVHYAIIALRRILPSDCCTSKVHLSSWSVASPCLLEAARKKRMASVARATIRFEKVLLNRLSHGGETSALDRIVDTLMMSRNRSLSNVPFDSPTRLTIDTFTMFEMTFLLNMAISSLTQTPDAGQQPQQSQSATPRQRFDLLVRAWDQEKHSSS